MKQLIFLFVLIFSSHAFSEDVALTIGDTIYNNSELEFRSHSRPGAFGSYLTMRVDYGPVSTLWKDLEKRIGKKLKNRGEAHITVITPVEYNRVLKNKLSIKEIDDIAIKANIQSSSFQIDCLGKFGIKISNTVEETYFIVLSSKKLLNIRKDIEVLYLERGGKKEDFIAEKFYPHITVGFTKRDLHESDGALKDKSSCFAHVN